MPSFPSRVRHVLAHPPGELTAKVDETRTRIVQLEAERDLLRDQAKNARTSERSLVAEIRRLRDVAYRDPGARPSDGGRRYLVIVSIGGGPGTSLVQETLNRVPGVIIRSDTGGLLHDLFRLQRNALYHRDRLVKAHRFMPTTNAWWGIDGYPQDLALRELRRLVTDLLLRPDADSHTLGFVETAWPEQPIADYLQFLREVFPGARFILSSRDDDPAWMALRAAVDDLGPDGLDLSDQDLTGDPDALQPLFAWLAPREITRG